MEADDYIFFMSEDHVQREDGAINITVGGAHILINSGTWCNIINKQTWQELKRQGIVCETRKEAQVFHMDQGSHWKPWKNVIKKNTATEIYKYVKTEIYRNFFIVAF